MLRSWCGQPRPDARAALNGGSIGGILAGRRCVRLRHVRVSEDGVTMAESYRRAGVDIDAGAAAVAAVRQHVRATFGPQVLTGIGGFGGLYAYDGGPGTVLVASADGVGTKVKLAIALDRHDTIGADLVNHCVNDILCCGARPLFFLDYL